MAIPTAPTSTTICTEALKRKLNGATPATADVTRAVDYGLEKVKRDIMLVNTLWSPLISSYYTVTKEGVSKYANPPDLEKHISLELLKYDHSGSLTAVDNTNRLYTLAVDEDASKNEVEGKLLLISSGTGANQAVQVDDYDTSTKVATGAEAFATAPAVSDGYLIVNEFYEIAYEPLFRTVNYRDKGEPCSFYPCADATYGYVELYPVPDAVYGLKFTYFADLRRVDLTSSLYSTILRRWAAVLEQGVYVWTLGEDDNRYEREFQIYDSMLKQIKARDGFMMSDPSGLVRSIVE